jgi:hypothetical protein
MKTSPQLRRLVAALGMAVLLTLAVPAFSNSGNAGCLFGGSGCGTSSNECSADCSNGVFCVPSGDPFEQCDCNQGACSTVECEITHQ